MAYLICLQRGLFALTPCLGVSLKNDNHPRAEISRTKSSNTDLQRHVSVLTHWQSGARWEQVYQLQNQLQNQLLESPGKEIRVLTEKREQENAVAGGIEITRPRSRLKMETSFPTDNHYVWEAWLRLVRENRNGYGEIRKGASTAACMLEEDWLE